MTDAPRLHLAVDVRAGRTLLTTVRDDRVIDVRRLDHATPPTAASCAAELAVLRERAPGQVLGLAGVWRHTQRLGVADPLPFGALLAEVAERVALPAWWLPHGAALALGEWTRLPGHGPLAVLALDHAIAGGVVRDGVTVDPLRLDLGHIGVRADGIKCACGARGCLENYATETAMYALAGDFDLTLERSLGADWQTLADAHFAALHHDALLTTHVIAHRAGWAIGVAAAHLGDMLGVTELRVRTRHPDLWRVLAPTAHAALSQVAGDRAPALTSADPGEDAFFVGAVVAGR